MAWLRRRLIGIEGWRRGLLAFALGALVTVSLPPLHAWPALIVGFTGLVWILDGCARPRSACLAGWWFGFGYFGFGLYWIASALTIEPERVGWMIPFAALGLPAAFAASGFRRRFEEKGRFSSYLAAIPTYVVLHEFPAFLGLASLVRESSTDQRPKTAPRRHAAPSPPASRPG